MHLLVLRHVDPPAAGWNGHENLAQHDRARRRELVEVRVVVLARLFFRHADPPEHLVLLHARHDHLLFQIPPQIGHRHVFLLESGLELFVRFELVFLLDVVEDGLELLVAELVAELLASLHDEHLIDGVDHDLRRDFVERLAELLVALVAFQIDLLAALPQRRNLQLLEVGFREDLAVHLHQNLLDDLGPRDADRQGNGEERRKEDGSMGSLHKCPGTNILSPIEQLAQ